MVVHAFDVIPGTATMRSGAHLKCSAPKPCPRLALRAIGRIIRTCYDTPVMCMNFLVIVRNIVLREKSSSRNGEKKCDYNDNSADKDLIVWVICFCSGQKQRTCGQEA